MNINPDNLGTELLDILGYKGTREPNCQSHKNST